MNLKEDHEQGGVCWCGQEHEVITGQERTGQELAKWQKENFATKAAKPSFTQAETGMIRPDPISHAIELNKSDATAILRNLREFLYRQYGNYQTADRLLRQILEEIKQ